MAGRYRENERREMEKSAKGRRRRERVGKARIGGKGEELRWSYDVDDGTRAP